MVWGQNSTKFSRIEEDGSGHICMYLYALSHDVSAHIQVCIYYRFNCVANVPIQILVSPNVTSLGMESCRGNQVKVLGWACEMWEPWLLRYVRTEGRQCVRHRKSLSVASWYVEPTLLSCGPQTEHLSMLGLL